MVRVGIGSDRLAVTGIISVLEHVMLKIDLPLQNDVYSVRVLSLLRVRIICHSGNIDLFI